MVPETKTKGTSGLFCLAIVKADKPSKEGRVKSEMIKSNCSRSSAI